MRGGGEDEHAANADRPSALAPARTNIAALYKRRRPSGLGFPRLRGDMCWILRRYERGTRCDSHRGMRRVTHAVIDAVAAAVAATAAAIAVAVAAVALG